MHVDKTFKFERALKSVSPISYCKEEGDKDTDLPKDNSDSAKLESEPCCVVPASPFTDRRSLLSQFTVCLPPPGVCHQKRMKTQLWLLCDMKLPYDIKITNYNKHSLIAPYARLFLKYLLFSAQWKKSKKAFLHCINILLQKLSILPLAQMNPK